MMPQSIRLPRQILRANNAPGVLPSTPLVHAVPCQDTVLLDVFDCDIAHAHLPAGNGDRLGVIAIVFGGDILPERLHEFGGHRSHCMSARCKPAALVMH